MYYIENNKTYNVGKNPNGGAYIQIFTADKEEAEALQEAGFGLRCRKGWSLKGDYFFETEKIYGISTCYDSRTSEGGAYYFVMNIIQTFRGKKLLSRKELDILPGLSKSPDYAELIKLREEIYRKREKLAREGKRHMRCIFDGVEITPKTTKNELKQEIDSCPGLRIVPNPGHPETLLQYLQDRYYQWACQPDLPYLAKTFGLDVRFIEFFKDNTKTLCGERLKIARKILNAASLVNMIPLH